MSGLRTGNVSCRHHWLLAGLLLLLLPTSCSPSEQAVATAIAKTQEAAPSPTASPTAPPTATPTPTATQTPRPTPTRIPSPTPPPLSLPSSVPSEVNDWSILIYDTFESPSSGWDIGQTDTSFAEGIIEIADGVLRWQHEALHSFIGWLPAPVGSLSDFYMSVEVGMVSGTSAAYQGLFFRGNDDGMYFFVVQENQIFTFQRWAPGDVWKTIIYPVIDGRIRPGQVNHLAVFAKGGSFRFYINDRQVGTASDSKLQSGSLGVTAGVWAVGREAIWEFDNFVVLTP